MSTTGRPDPIGIRDRSTAAPDFLRAAFERLPIGVLMADVSGAIVLVNRELERIFGYSSAELIGQSVDVLVSDSSPARPADLRAAFLHPPQAQVIGLDRELFGRHKNGSEVLVEIGLTPIPFEGSQLVVASVSDVTERRRVEVALRTAHDERLRFETLVSEVGAEFINLRHDDVDHGIEDALGRVVRTLDLDRGAIFQLVEDSGDFVHTHQWTRPGWAAPPPRVSAQEQFPWHLAQVRARELVAFTTVDEVPDAIDRESLHRLGTKSSVIVPLVVSGRTWGAVSFGAVRATRSWTPALVNRLRVIAVIFANALARKQQDEALRRALAELAALRNQLRDENAYLRHELQLLSGASAIVGHSPAIRRVLEQVRQVAPTESPVLLLGEPGTGKTLLAGRVHELSPRRERAMIRANCASLSAAWIEQELFGSERASLDDAPRHAGRLELANGSTVFLDEVADLPLDAQANLTRALQEKQIHALGSATATEVNIRIVASTRRDLTHAIAQGTFREDLYDLLNVFPIQVPPLRERPEDIPLLVWRFVDEFSAAYGKPIDTIDKETMAALQAYSWPGNARELRNIVERAMIMATGRNLRIPVPGRDTAPSRRSDTLDAVEKAHITTILSACNGKIEGKRGAAARLGLTPAALRKKMATLRIRGSS